MSAEPMSAEEIRAARERADAATPGPWVPALGLDGIHADEMRRVCSADFGYVADTGGGFCGRFNDWRREEENAAFVAHARTDIPRLIATIEATRLVPDEDGVLHTEHEKFLFDQMEAFRLDRDAERARADAAEAKLAERSFTCDECAKHVLYGPSRDSWQDVTPL